MKAAIIKRKSPIQTRCRLDYIPVPKEDYQQAMKEAGSIVRKGIKEWMELGRSLHQDY